MTAKKLKILFATLLMALALDKAPSIWAQTAPATGLVDSLSISAGAEFPSIMKTETWDGPLSGKVERPIVGTAGLKVDMGLVSASFDCGAGLDSYRIGGGAECRFFDIDGFRMGLGLDGAHMTWEEGNSICDRGAASLFFGYSMQSGVFSAKLSVGAEVARMRQKWFDEIGWDMLCRLGAEWLPLQAGNSRIGLGGDLEWRTDNALGAGVFAVMKVKQK